MCKCSFAFCQLRWLQYYTMAMRSKYSAMTLNKQDHSQRKGVRSKTRTSKASFRHSMLGLPSSHRFQSPCPPISHDTSPIRRQYRVPLAQEEASGRFSSHGGTAGQEDSSPQRDSGLIYSTSCCKQQLDTVTPVILLPLLHVVGSMQSNVLKDGTAHTSRPH